MALVDLTPEELVTIGLALEDVCRSEFTKCGSCMFKEPCERQGNVLFCSECEHAKVESLRYHKAHRLYHRLLAEHMSYVLNEMRQ